jgi:RNA polymerase sigma-70 factor, ECF subfamily
MRPPDVQTMTLAGDDVTPRQLDTRGDRLAALFERHQARLYRFALRLASDDEEAKDLVQDAFIRAASARIPDDDAAAGAWLVRVVVNLARDRWRRNRVRDLAKHALGRESHDPRPAMDAAVTVRTALASLPPRQRAVITLHYLDGESVASIAVTLRLARVTVRWHLAAARQRLAALLRETLS